MPRPLLLAFLLLVLIITSQFEWKQPLMTDIENTLSIAQKQTRVSVRQEAVKEKIIISQEQRIQKLYELVRSLKEQLSQCRSSKTKNSTTIPLPEHFIELEQKQVLED
ncbi:hypothetical protein BT93_J0475 [Corymbia citriodora subsp. variegata]|nr:hypothetical protein BT93_J0475 [Corymbia citriodora subsp. variegata]